MSPSSGSGTGTAVSCSVPGLASLLVQPFPYTLLSLSRYAHLVGIPPMHFWGATAPNLNPQVFPTGTCDMVWAKYPWQNYDQISRMEVALKIKEAEEDILSALGYPPAPMWFADERHQYTRVFNQAYSGSGFDITGRPKTIEALWGKIISGGRRGASLICTAYTVGGTLVYQDLDSDGYYETAVISAATSVTDIGEIRVFYTGYGGDEEYEIRWPRSITISGGVATIVMDSWLLFDPELYEAYPTDEGFEAIDAGDTSLLLTAVDVYRIYNDTSDNSSEFAWENELVTSCGCGLADCENCVPVTQDGCLTVRHFDGGIVTPIPANYSGGSWAVTEFAECRAPDWVKLWYYAGNRGQRYLTGNHFDPLDDKFARAIAMIATARLPKSPCGCSAVNTIYEDWSADLSASSQGSARYFMTKDALDSPFGTRKGEVMAWRMLNKLTRRKIGVAVI